MKFLADMGVSLLTVGALRAAGHDARSVSVNPKLFRVISEASSALTTGAIVTVEDAGFRVRRLPLN